MFFCLQGCFHASQAIQKHAMRVLHGRYCWKPTNKPTNKPGTCLGSTASKKEKKRMGTKKRQHRTKVNTFKMLENAYLVEAIDRALDLGSARLGRCGCALRWFWCFPAPKRSLRPNRPTRVNPSNPWRFYVATDYTDLHVGWWLNPMGLVRY